MKEKLIIKRGNDVLYNGSALDMPIKEKSIIDLSIEIFGDEDPCVIHQSFVVKELVTDLLELFDKKETNIISCSDYSEQLSFINFKDLSSLTIEIVGRK